MWQRSLLEYETRAGVVSLDPEWEFGAYSDKRIYAPSEAVNTTVYARNIDAVSHNLFFGAKPQVYYSIYAESGSAVRPFNGLFLFVISTVTVMPNETHEWNFSWNQKNISGEPVPWPAYYEFEFGTTGRLPQFEPVWVAVTDVDHCSAKFETTPGQPSPGESIEFNASESKNSIGGHEGIRYRWDWDGDWVWDTDWSLESTSNHTFPATGDFLVRLQVCDIAGNSACAEVLVIVGNEPIPEFGTIIIPVASVTAAFVTMSSRRKRR